MSVGSVGFGSALGDPVPDLREASQADPAGDRLAACLVRGEAGQEPREVDHAGPVVRDDHGAGPDVGAGPAQRFEGVGRVEEVGREDAARGAADEQCLERPRAAAAREVDERPERRAQRHLGDARTLGAAELDEHGPGAARVAGPLAGARIGATAGANAGASAGPAADRREAIRSLADDPRHRSECLDVVHDGGPLPEAALGRVGRLLLGLAAPALQGLEQHGLLAQHVRTLDRSDRHRHAMPGAEDVVAQEAGLLRGEHGALEHRDQPRIVGTEREDGLGCSRDERGDREALDHDPRIRTQERGACVDGRVRVVGVGDDVPLVRVVRRGGAPLLARGHARATAAAQTRGGDRGDRPGGAQVPDDPPEPLEGAGLHSPVQVRRIRCQCLDAPGEDERPVARGREEGAHRPWCPPPSAGPPPSGPP